MGVYISTYTPTAKSIAGICGNRGMNCLGEAKEAIREIYTEVKAAPPLPNTPSDNQITIQVTNIDTS